MRVLVAGRKAKMTYLIDVLRELGFDDIVTAINGREAFDKIMASRNIPGKEIRLCFSSWNMDPVSGLDLLRTIRAEKEITDTVFIFATSEVANERILEARKEGVDEYLIKPFKFDTLKNKLENITRNKLANIEKAVNEYLDGAGKGREGLDSVDKEEIGKFISAIMKKFDQTLVYAPWTPFPLLAKGKVYMRFKKYGEAEKWIRKAVATDFNYTEGHAMLSKVLRASGKMGESVSELETALAVNPKSLKVRQKLGELYVRTGNYDRAIIMLSESLRSLEAQSGSPKAKAANLTALGTAKVEKGDEEADALLAKEGVNDLEKAAGLDSDLIAAQYNLMAAYMKTGQNNKASEIFKHIQKMEPDTAEEWFDIGKAFVAKDEIHKALNAFSKVKRLAKEKYELYVEVARVFYKNKFNDYAIEYAKMAMAENPSGKEAYNIAGLIHRAMGKTDLALNEYKRAIAIDPEDAAIHFNLGVAAVFLGQKEQGAEAFKKAVKLDQDLESLVETVMSRAEK